MIKFTYAQLNNPGFVDAVARLAQTEDLASAKVSFNVARIYRQVSQKLKEARTEFAAMSEPFLLKDEAGKPIPAEQPSAFQYKINPEKQDEFEKQTVEFFNQELSIESHPVSIDDLGDAKITPADILSLGPIIVEVSSTSEVPSQTDLKLAPQESPSH